jgi:tripartite-type tricarboxylate transporter receptor subunit TctC
LCCYDAGPPKPREEKSHESHLRIIDKLNQKTNAALTDLKIKARMAESGGTVLRGSPADFGKLIAEETEKWSEVVRAANIKPGS